jgi:hypothetical protein
VSIESVWTGEWVYRPLMHTDSELHAITALSLISALYKSQLSKSLLAFSVFTSCCLVTALNYGDSSASMLTSLLSSEQTSRNIGFPLPQHNIHSNSFFFLWFYSPIIGLGRLHETFRLISVTRSRTVSRTPWTGDQLVGRHLLTTPGDCDDGEVDGMNGLNVMEGSGRDLNEVLSQHLCGETEGEEEKHQSGRAISQPRFKPRNTSPLIVKIY